MVASSCVFRLVLGSVFLISASGCPSESESTDPTDGGAGGSHAHGGSLNGSGGSPADGGAGGIGGVDLGGMGGTGGVPLMGDPCAVDGRAGVCVDVSECTVDGWAPTPGFCPGPANIQCCTPQPAGTCDENAMPLPNAGIAPNPGIGGCPDGMIPVADFCVDQYEAFLVTYPEMLPVSPYFNPGDASVMAVSAPNAIPQGYITQVQADDACFNAGKRLCTDTEWLRACQGPDDYTYPYGDTLALGVCNDHRDQHPVIEYFGTNADWIWSELGNPCINQLHDSLDDTGANPGCETVEGAYDMMGNLHEWTADPAGTFRGGYYVDTVINGPGCLYKTTAHDVHHWDYSTGFRCCADP
ncbi:MAG: SUMF1/EgtB/PvdO family nonheme iron enzyme [Polyangiaceae bacterium]